MNNSAEWERRGPGSASSRRPRTVIILAKTGRATRLRRVYLSFPPALEGRASSPRLSSFLIHIYLDSGQKLRRIYYWTNSVGSGRGARGGGAALFFYSMNKQYQSMYVEAELSVWKVDACTLDESRGFALLVSGPIYEPCGSAAAPRRPSL